MTAEREIKKEIKSAQELQRLLECLPAPIKHSLQLNLYIDTNDGRLADSGQSFRLRVSTDKAWATLKSERRIEQGAFVCDEYEQEIDRKQAIEWLLHIGQFPVLDGKLFAGLLPEFRMLQVINWAVTHRTVSHFKGLVFEMDETMFSDGSFDWEVEIECDDPDFANAVLLEVANNAGIELGDQTLTKQARAMARKPVYQPWIPTGQASLGIPSGVLQK